MSVAVFFDQDTEVLDYLWRIGCSTNDDDDIIGEIVRRDDYTIKEWFVEHGVFSDDESELCE